jgi:hypothetical protein
VAISLLEANTEAVDACSCLAEARLYIYSMGFALVVHEVLTYIDFKVEPRWMNGSLFTIFIGIKLIRTKFTKKIRCQLNKDLEHVLQ